MALGDQNSYWISNCSQPLSAVYTCGQCGLTYDSSMGHSCRVQAGNVSHTISSGGFVPTYDDDMNELLQKIEELSMSLDAMARILMALQEQVDALKEPSG